MEGQLPTNQASNKGLWTTLLVLALLIVAGLVFWWSWKNQTVTPMKQSETKQGTPAPTPAPEPTQPTANEQKAVDLVRARADVQTWLKLFTGPDMTSLTTKGKAMVDADHEEDGVVTVHVYEQLADHTATMGWYSVNTKTWVVKKDI